MHQSVMLIPHLWQYASFPKLVYVKSTRRRQSVVTDCACAQSCLQTWLLPVQWVRASRLDFSKYTVKGFWLIEVFRALKSQKLNLYYWVKRQKIATVTSSPVITSYQKESGGGRQGKHAVSVSINQTRCQWEVDKGSMWTGSSLEKWVGGCRAYLPSRVADISVWLLDRARQVDMRTSVWLMTLMSMLMLTPEVLMSAEGSFIHWRRLADFV